MRIAPNVSLYGAVFNITRAKVYQYENQPEMPRFVDYDGCTFTLTIKGSF